MGIKKDEKDIYNLANREVSLTNKRLFNLYKQSLKETRDKLLAFQARSVRDGVVRKYTEDNLRKLIREIQTEMATLTRNSSRIVFRGYKANYENTYYLQNWAFEKSVNLDLGINVKLNIPSLNKDIVKASFDERIGGHIFRDRALRVQRAMQYNVQDAVSQSLIKGESVKSLAKNLSQLNDVYSSGLNNTERIARTELLKAYSIGQDASRVEAEKSGVEFTFSWNALLGPKTRDSHSAADGQEGIVDEATGEPIFIVGGLEFTSPRIPLVSTGSKNEAAQVINCRCRRQNQPYGVKPATRNAKTKEGNWKTVNGDITAREWVKKEYGRTLKV